MSTSEPKPDAVINDYSAYNQAVEAELIRVVEHGGAVRAARWRAIAIVACWAALAVSILVIGIAFAYRIFQTPVVSTTSINDSQQTLESLNESQASSDPLIATNFTVFKKAVMADGSFVITGKDFLPSDLANPSRQYCYWEQQSDSGQKIVTTLAFVDAGQVVPEPGLDARATNALALCEFQTQ